MLSAEWFGDAVSPAVVMAGLNKAVPELDDLTVELLGCRVTRIRSVPDEDSWTALYQLDLRDAETGRERTFTAQGVLTAPGLDLPSSSDGVRFGTSGWSCVLPDLRLHLRAVPFHDALPGLGVIADPVLAQLLLQDSLRDWLPDGTVLSSCVPSVLGHKSGVRATVRCRLEYVGDPAGLPTAVVVKVHNGDEGRRAFEAMQALWSSSLGRSETVRLAEPIAYLPELSLSIQQHVEHQISLKELFHRAFDSTPEDWTQLLDAMRRTAAGLAALHRCGTAHGDSVTWDDELAKLRKKHQKLVAVVPGLQDRIGSVPDRLRAAAARAVPDPLGPSHHSFRPSQVLLGDGAVGFIDFDKFCQAEPASDIALLTSKLVHMGTNKIDATRSDLDRTGRLAELRATFLEEYRRHASVSTDRLALWEAMELLSLVLSAVKKTNTGWVESCQRLLEQHLDAAGI